MTNEYERTNPQSVERRRFLKMSAKLGVGATVAALGGEVLITDEAFAEAAKKESELKAAAEHTMILGTAYAPGVSRSYPIMQRNFKTNIQNASNGKIYVQLAPSGRVGGGSALAREVQKATIHAGQCSFSNFSPFVPEVDLVNIPYWCSENQKFVNLVTSDIWKREIHPKIEARGFKPLWYPCIDPRTLALRKGIEAPVKTPDQLRGLKFRIPNSEMMLNVYRQLGANPIPIAWGESAVALKLGRADALDPAVGALYVFGFESLLSYIVFTDIVHDAQIYFCNLEWFKQLPLALREALESASEMTMRQNHAQVPSARAHAMTSMTAAGVKFYTLSPEEKKLWVEKVGAQHPFWNDVKQTLAGSLSNFEAFKTAADTMGDYAVLDKVEN